MLTNDEFARQVRDALNHLYDSPYLQVHPLAALLAASDSDPQQRSQALRQILLLAIKKLHPPAGIPAGSPDWRLYKILELRYIEGLSPNDAMSRLALEKSRYFQEQARAVDGVTSVLWEHWQARLGADESVPGAVEPDEDGLARREVERLLDEAHWEPVEIASVLEELGSILDALAAINGAEVVVNPLPPLTLHRADRVILRQVLLNVLSRAIVQAIEGKVTVQALGKDEAGLRISAQPGSAGRQIQPAESESQQAGSGENLEVSRWLMTAMGGVLEENAAGQAGWETRLIWGPARPFTLLVIDDNQGLIDLFRRYLAGSRWEVIGAHNGAEARAAIAQALPTVIMLDVMMPGEDGWEVLASLRQALAPRTVPMIVCSVLSAQSLAQALDVGYLPKPVTRQALRQALAPWAQGGASLAPTS